MFSYPLRKTKPIELEGLFTPEETIRIMTLHRQFHIYPDRYRFDINYQRLEFARWLVIHGYLDEWSDRQIDQVDMDGEVLKICRQKHPAYCA